MSHHEAHIPSREEVVTLTKPSPSTIPFGAFAGMLVLVDSPPDAFTGATRPSEPEITAAVAFAGAWPWVVIVLPPSLH